MWGQLGNVVGKARSVWVSVEVVDRAQVASGVTASERLILRLG
ncbi:hypothetical protein BSU04_25700 [Caballeronia sordidicola]|uniref:Uncharacterized protein n=1 Tax=Caballeronia sordidicola TaxID=196367 RepID=A0A226WXX0_CABSO|nr:hypothetical protein BSU04_25700 [Caballeronia sordidicola]